MRTILVPGELISDKTMHGEGIIVENGKSYASVIGIYDSERQGFIPLESIWSPQQGENIVGVIDEAKLNTYNVNLHSPYKGVIISKYAEGGLSNGDIIEATVRGLDKTGVAVLVRPRVLRGGKLISIKPSKIPRILGRGNTMIKQISDYTKTSISIGMNGMVWLNGGDIDLATDAIERIQNEAHITGLTEKIGEMLKSNEKR